MTETALGAPRKIICLETYWGDITNADRMIRIVR